MHAPDQGHRQEYGREISDYVDGRGRGGCNERIEACTRGRWIPGLMNRRTLKDGHDNLGRTVAEDNDSDYPASNHEASAGTKDAAIQQQGRKFD